MTSETVVDAVVSRVPCVGEAILDQRVENVHGSKQVTGRVTGVIHLLDYPEDGESVAAILQIEIMKD